MHVAMDVQQVSQCTHSRSVVRRWGMRCHGSWHAVPPPSDCSHIGGPKQSNKYCFRTTPFADRIKVLYV